MAVVIGLILGGIVTGAALYRHGVRCRVAARQPGLAVLADGRDTGARTGEGSIELRLPPGRHIMSLRARGAPPFADREVQVEPGQMCEVSFDGADRAVKVQIDIVGGARAGQRLSSTPVPSRSASDATPTTTSPSMPSAIATRRGATPSCAVDGGQLWLYDLGSANGTRLQGRPVAGKAPVAAGREIEFGAGGPRVRVSYEGAAPPLPRRSLEPVTPVAAGSVGAGGKVGQRTVALMIEQALARARREPERLRVLVVALAALLVVTVGGVVVAYRLRPPAGVALRREMVEVMEQQRAASDAERAQLQKKLDELGGKLQRAGGKAGGADIARANRAAIWLVTVHARRGRRRASARRSPSPTSRLVTNAHCVAAAEELRRRGGQIVVVQNGDARVRLTVERMRRVRGFRAGRRAHLARRRLARGRRQAAGEGDAGGRRRSCQALATGDPMFTYGFPGRLADVSAPEATFVEGVVGRITTLDGRAGRRRRAAAHPALRVHLGRHLGEPDLQRRRARRRRQHRRLRRQDARAGRLQLRRCASIWRKSF